MDISSISSALLSVNSSDPGSLANADYDVGNEYNNIACGMVRR